MNAEGRRLRVKLSRLLDDGHADSWCLDFVERVGTTVYRGADYRVSLLSHRDSADHIEPLYRYESGNARRVTGVHLRFRRGVPVAGTAWERPHLGVHDTTDDLPLVLSVDARMEGAFVMEVGGESFVRGGGKLVAMIKSAFPSVRSTLKGDPQ